MSLVYLQERGGKGHLFVTRFPGWGDVPFKLPSVKRAQQYSAALALTEDTRTPGSVILEQIFRECVVDENLAYHEHGIPAGVVDSVGRGILYLSGVSEEIVEYTENLFNTYRHQVNTMIPSMKRIVCSVFGSYTFNDVDELDYQDMCETFIQAERALLEGGVIEEPYKFGTEQEEVGFSSEAAAQQAALEGRDPSRAMNPQKEGIFQQAERNTRMDNKARQQKKTVDHRVQKLREHRIREAKQKSHAAYRRE